MSDEQLENIAQAIWRADENAHERGWWEVSERWRDHYMRLAQAAVAAFRQPASFSADETAKHPT